ncbi:THUMP domain-containing protein [Vogesella sp. GCM10023246]|uniref:THUMP domain-containing protein n=1 Tax=Vogesella oryzagri TaxID=3160864 RepID=A0ABV1M5J9_9NEIS
MSTFRSRQRAAVRRQPTTPAERNAPPAGHQTPAAGQAPAKPRFGGERREGGVKREGERNFDKPRFGGDDKPRVGGGDKPRVGGGERREGGFKREGERNFDKPRFGGGERHEGGFKREGERSFDKPRFGGEDKPRFGGGEHREGGFKREGERSFDKPRFGGDDKPRFGGGERREGDFKREGERNFDKPRFGSDDKPRFGGGERREGGFKREGDRSFDKPRFGGDDKPRFGGGERREGGFKREGERSFDKPRFGGDDKPRFGGGERREGGFKREGESQPRGERNFGKPRYNNEHREGGFKREGEFQPRGERDFDRARHNAGDKPRFGGDDKPRYSNEHREGGFRHNDGLKRDGNSPHQRHEFQPRGDHAIEKPRTLFGGKTVAPSAPAASEAPAERRYTRDRVAGRGGKTHPDYIAPPIREDAETATPPAPSAAAPRSGTSTSTSFLKRVSDEQPGAPRSSEQPAADSNSRDDGFKRDGGFQPRGEREFDRSRHGADKPQPRFGGERRDGGFQPRGEREFDRSRHGTDKPRFGGDDKPRFGGERRDGDFQPRGEREFDRSRHGTDKPRFGSNDKPRFGGERRDGGFQPRGEQPRALFDKGQAEGGDAGGKVGRTPFVKTQFRALQENELALFASCPRGLEKILADEISLQGGSELQLTDGGIAFIGNREVMMRVNLHSRVASRVLMQLAQGSFQEERDIYTLAHGIDWPALFEVSRTIKVNTDGHSRLRSMDYVSLLVKDAICDRFREACGERPSVDTRHPDMRIRVFISGFDVQIYLDTSGEALFKRGWREETGEAPLRENLAAGILLLAGYTGSQPLLDPMCGSGTFLVEAADIAMNRAPGRARRFGFELLLGHNDLLWHSIRNDAELAQRKLASLPLFGNDRDPQLVEITRRNLARADIEQLVTLSCGDATALAAPAANGLIVCNPPYGVRLDEQESLAELYPQLATWLKRNFAGWHAHFMTADSRLPSLMRLSVSSRPQLFNGPLACHVYGFELVAGSNRKEKSADDSQ